MAKERLSMRKIKEVLRLYFEHKQSIRFTDSTLAKGLLRAVINAV
jgi:hypothetical protein